MTKIVLVNPPVTKEKEYGLLTEGISVGGPPLSLLYLGAVTRKENFETKIIDCLASRFDHKKATEVTLHESPKYLGITATSVSIHSAAKLAKMIKEDNPKIITIIGGAHIISLPEETMRRFPQFDVGVTGEGEITLVELLNALENKRDLENIEGLIIRKDSQPYITPRRPLIKDLDTLPMPAWDLLPGFPHKYQPALYRLTRLPAAFLVTVRGCPYSKCTFCDRSFLGSSYRVHSLDYVFKMIKTLVRDYNIRDLTIYDEDFTSHRSRLIKFCERMKGEGLNLVWSCSGRASPVTQKTIRIMKEAGCRAISFGIESAVPEILEVYKKKIDLEQVEKVLHWSKEAGMLTEGFFMIGGPLETEETIKKSLDWAKMVDLDFMFIAYLTPFPGTEIRKGIEQYGTFNEDWQKMSQVEIVFIPKGLTEDKLRYWYRRWILEFYLRPKIAFSLLKNMRNFTWFIRILRGGIILLRILLKRKKVSVMSNNRTEFYEKFWDETLNLSNIGKKRLRPDEIDLDEEIDFYTSPSQEYALKSMGNIRNKKILELGCGLGINAIILTKGGAYVTATDIAQKRVEWARELIARTGLEERIQVQQMSAENLKFGPDSFDIIYGRDILIHTNIDLVLKECKRVLKGGGKIIFIEPLKYHPLLMLYRYTLAPKIWRKFTRYLTFSDIKKINIFFPGVQHKEFYLLGFMAFIWCFVFPDRKRFKRWVFWLHHLDEKIIKILPLLKRLCWRSVIYVEKI